MRLMRSEQTQEVIEVVEHIILKNGWEFYVTPDFVDESVALALVMGFEVEFGPVDLDEISPHVVSRTRKTKELSAAPQWEWV